MNKTLSNNYYMSYNINNINIIIEAAQKGVKLLEKDIDYLTLLVWQRYIQSVFDLIFQKSNINFCNVYSQFNLSIMMYPPYEQVKKTVELLIEIAKQMRE